MKTRYMVSLVMLTGALTMTMAQVPAPQKLMKDVLEKNRELKVAREAYKTALAEAGSGITPPDPEVEFGYLFGKPSSMGNRVDFSVTQQVDFPTAYLHRSRVRKIEEIRAELIYASTRQEVLLQAQQLWIDRLYLNQQENFLRKRIWQAKVINDHFRQKLAIGEVGQLAFSQSNLQLAALLNEQQQILVEIQTNQMALEELSAGSEVEINETSFPPRVLYDPDSVRKAYLDHPGYKLTTSNLEMKEAQKNLMVSLNLPRLSAGYYSESVLDQHFQGVQVGITVPLWENANRIKGAQSDILYAQADVDRFLHHQNKEVEEKLARLESLDIRIKQLEDALGTANEMEVLSLAMENGEISLSEYFYSSDLYCRNQMQLLEMKRDLLIQEAELLKVYL